MKNNRNEAIYQALAKASRTIDRQAAAISSGNTEEFNHQVKEYGRYSELFSQAMKISEEDFRKLVMEYREDPLFLDHQS